MSILTQDQTRYAYASSLSDVLDAWGFLYERYMETGFIQSNEFKLHTSICALGSQTSVTVARRNDEVVGTISTIQDSPDGFPMEAVYPAEIQQLRCEGRRMVEIGLFADRHDENTNSFDTVFDLMRYATLAAMNDGATDIICGIAPRHVKVYRRILGFTPIGAESTYGVVSHAPVVLMRGDLEKMFLNQKSHCAVKYFAENPLPAETFANRFAFSNFAIATSRLGAMQRAAAALVEETAFLERAAG